MRRRTWLVSILVAAAAGAVVSVWKLGDGRVVEDEGRARGPSWSMRWEPGKLYRYHLDYAAAHDVMPFVGLGSADDVEVQSDVSYVGELHVRALGAPGADGSWRLGVRLPACESAIVEVSGETMLEEGLRCDELFGPWELVVEVDARGRPGQVREPRDAPEVFGYLAAYFASELAVTWPPGGTRKWEAREIDMLGIAESAYRIVSEDGARVRVERRRERYTELDAAALLNGPWQQNVRGLHKLRLHRDGHLEEMTGAQTVVANAGGSIFLRATARLRLRLLSLGVDDTEEVAHSAYDARPLKQARGGARSDARALRDRTGGLTPAAALSSLARFAGGGRLPDHNRFLWQMTALLRVHPELASELAPIFATGNSRARALVLDLLAGAGTAEAQAVMRSLIASDATRDDPDRHLLSQRLGLLEEPDEQTVDFVRARFAASARKRDSDDYHSAAYTLGAVAGRADDEARRELRAMLASELGRTSDPTAVAHLLSALSNAKDPADAARFADYAEHPDSDVRRAAAAALGRPVTEQGHTTLLRLVADFDRGVQKQAIRSLRRYPLRDRDLEALASVVAHGGLHHTNARPMLELTKLFRRELPAGSRRLIQALIDAGIRDNQVLAAAHRLLRAR